MAELSFATVEIAFALIWLACRVAAWLRQGRVEWRREAVLLLMYVNLAVIIRFTFFPFSLVDGRVQPLVFDLATAFPPRINLEPLVRLSDYGYKSDKLINIIGNLGLFVPTGIILPIVYRRLDTFWKVVGAGFLISLAIEILQLPFTERVTDIDDLILNVAGVIVGYAIFALARAIRSRRTPARHRASGARLSGTRR